MNTGSLPPPTAFGLPPTFAQWRQDQVEALSLILDSPTRYVALTMPTGAGKSLCYIAAAVLSGKRTVILTSTKGLQDQLSFDYGDLSVDVRGQGSYPCLGVAPGQVLEDFAPHKVDDPAYLPMCDEGPCHAGVVCSLKMGGCLYYDHYRKALTSNVVITNYAYWLAQHRYGDGMGKVDLLILDEAHEAEMELAGSLTIQLPRYELQLAGVTTPDQNATLSQMRDWALYWGNRVRKQVESYGIPETSKEVHQARRRMRVANALDQMRQVTTDGNWIADHTDYAYEFKIVRPSAYRESLLREAGKVVLTSATLTTETLRHLGIPVQETTMWECPSRFPVANRLTTIIPTVRVDTRMTEASETIWLKRMDQIIAPRQERKGILHTISYKRRDLVLSRSDYSELMVTHSNKPGEAAKVVGRFRKQQSPGVLVSPSVMTGWDFPYDQCRYQIITKLPFPDSRSLVLKARAESDERYSAYLTMLALVQAVGRGTRAVDDWCETFIIDDHARWFIPKYKDLAPKWFLEAVRTSLTLPKPYST